MTYTLCSRLTSIAERNSRMVMFRLNAMVKPIMLLTAAQIFDDLPAEKESKQSPVLSSKLPLASTVTLP